ncbi:MAG: hypothetical protein IRZ10_03100 [Thermoflavifilum sp.]|nr:hypothetical protein [Thermoflavifilum sp.]MCL6513382.1 hypothetical protein [Alicyclobacillus sp.]
MKLRRVLRLENLHRQRLEYQEHLLHAARVRRDALETAMLQTQREQEEAVRRRNEMAIGADWCTWFHYEEFVRSKIQAQAARLVDEEQVLRAHRQAVEEAHIEVERYGRLVERARITTDKLILKLETRDVEDSIQAWRRPDGGAEP